MVAELEVCEGVEGMWHYHIREKGKRYSLCGVSVMLCHLPLSQWGEKIPNHHLPEKYCSKCDAKKDERRVLK